MSGVLRAVFRIFPGAPCSARRRCRSPMAVHARGPQQLRRAAPAPRRGVGDSAVDVGWAFGRGLTGPSPRPVLLRLTSLPDMLNEDGVRRVTRRHVRGGGDIAVSGRTRSSAVAEHRLPDLRRWRISLTSAGGTCYFLLRRRMRSMSRLMLGSNNAAMPDGLDRPSRAFWPRTAATKHTAVTGNLGKSPRLFSSSVRQPMPRAVPGDLVCRGRSRSAPQARCRRRGRSQRQILRQPTGLPFPGGSKRQRQQYSAPKPHPGDPRPITLLRILRRRTLPPPPRRAAGAGQLSGSRALACCRRLYRQHHASSSPEGGEDAGQLGHERAPAPSPAASASSGRAVCSPTAGPGIS